MPDPQEPTPLPVPGHIQSPANSGPAQPLNRSMSSQPIQSPLPIPPQANTLPTWVQHAERFLRVIVRLYLGLLVCCAPWYPPAWDNNPLFVSNLTLLSIVTNGAFRGLVSGLGLLNLWIAIRDALRNTPDTNPPQPN